MKEIIHELLQVFENGGKVKQKGVSAAPTDISNNVSLVTRLFLSNPSVKSKLETDPVSLIRQLLEMIQESTTQLKSSEVPPSQFSELLVQLRVLRKVLTKVKDQLHLIKQILPTIFEFIIFLGPAQFSLVLPHVFKLFILAKEHGIQMDQIQKDEFFKQLISLQLQARILNDLYDGKMPPPIFENYLTAWHKLELSPLTPTEIDQLSQIYILTREPIQKLIELCEESFYTKFKDHEPETNDLYNRIKEYFIQSRKAILNIIKSSLQTSVADKGVIVGKLLGLYEEHKQYLSEWIVIATSSQKNKNFIRPIFSLDAIESMKLIDTCLAIDYKRTQQRIEDSPDFWTNLEEWLLSKDTKVRKVAVYLLQIIVRNECSTNISLQQPWDTFFSIFTTLDCFGIHLIKAVTPSLGNIVHALATSTTKVNDNRKVLNLQWPLALILLKSSLHANLSVRRHVMKAFLKCPELTFTNAESFIFRYLLPGLNDSCFYKDAEGEKKTRFTGIIEKFFLNAVKDISNPKEINLILRTYLYDIIIGRIDYERAISALLNVFRALVRHSRGHIEGIPPLITGKKDVNLIANYISRHYMKLPLRKKLELLSTSFYLLLHYSQLNELEYNALFTILAEFPTELLKYPKTHDDDITKALQDALRNKPDLTEFRKDENVSKIFADVSALKEQIFLLLSVMKPGNMNELFPKVIWSGTKVVDNEEVKTFDVFLKYLVVLKHITDNLGFKNFDTIGESLKCTRNEIEQLTIFPLLERLGSFYSCSYVPLDYAASIMSLFSNVAKNKLIVTDDVKKLLYKVSKDLFPYLRLVLLETEPAKRNDLAYYWKPFSEFVHYLLLVLVGDLDFITSSNNAVLFGFLSELVSAFCQSGYKELEVGGVLTILLEVFNWISLTQETTFHIAALLIELLGDTFLNVVVGSLKSENIGKTREFMAFTQKFGTAFVSLFSRIPIKVHNEAFLNGIRQFGEEMSGVVDGFHIEDVEKGILSLIHGYIPYLVWRLQNGTYHEDIWEEYTKTTINLVKIIVESDISTSTQIETLFKFALDSRMMLMLAGKEIKPSSAIEKLFKKLFKYAKAQFFFARPFVNQIYLLCKEHPTLLPTFSKLIGKFIRLREYRGYDASVNDIHQVFIPTTGNTRKQYIPNDLKYEGLYPRFLMFSLLDGLKLEENRDFLTSFFLDLIEWNRKPKFHKASFSMMPYSPLHRKKLAMWQCICLLSAKLFGIRDEKRTSLPAFPQDFLKRVNEGIWVFLSQNNLPSVRQYMEVFAAYFFEAFPDRVMGDLLKYLSTHNLKAQLAISVTFLVGFLLIHGKGEISKRLSDGDPLHHFFVLTASNTAYLRAIAQYFCSQHLKRHPPVKDKDPFVWALNKFFDVNKDFLVLHDKIATLSEGFNTLLHDFSLEFLIATPLDDMCEIVHASVIEVIKSECAELQKRIREEDVPPPKNDEIWKLHLDNLASQNSELQAQIAPFKSRNTTGDEVSHKPTGVSNEEESGDIFQRKTHTVIENVLEENMRERQKFPTEIIVVATLLDKLPNFANLTRTCEVMGATALVIPNKNILNNEEYKTIAVTSEQWLPIIEVKERDLGEFLMLKKTEGFKVLGLEQTSRSVMLQDFKFPEKCVLLLGKEREGVPLEYLEILDVCIEIPQFGMIRSLNVHISAVICIWEYVKQHLAPNKALT